MSGIDGISGAGDSSNLHPKRRPEPKKPEPETSSPPSPKDSVEISHSPEEIKPEPLPESAIGILGIKRFFTRKFWKSLGKDRKVEPTSKTPTDTDQRGGKPHQGDPDDEGRGGNLDTEA